MGFLKVQCGNDGNVHRIIQLLHTHRHVLVLLTELIRQHEESDVESETLDHHDSDHSADRAAGALCACGNAGLWGDKVVLPAGGQHCVSYLQLCQVLREKLLEKSLI